MRKAFYIKNVNSDRFYHVSFDMCTTVNDVATVDDVITQMEVEYTGRFVPPSGDETAEDRIVEDIAVITRILLDSFPELSQSRTTKYEWLAQEQGVRESL